MKLADHIDPRVWLRSLRTGNSLSQARMSDLMGVPLRTYEDLEGGKTTIRPIHINAACMAMIEYAAENGGWQKLPEDLRQIARKATA